MSRRFSVLILLTAASVAGSAQSKPIAVGPAVGKPVPAFSASDQFGRTQTLESIMGPEGAMLVFYRSADW